MADYTLNENLFRALLAYLVEKPLKETYGLFTQMQSLKPVQPEQPKEQPKPNETN